LVTKNVRANTDEVEEVFSRKSAMPLQFANMEKFTTQDMKNNIRREQYFIQYTKEQVMTYVQNPSKWRRQLREISNNLYNISPQYKRVIQYFVSMPTFKYIVEPYGYDPDKVNKKTVKNQYLKNLDYIENMNIEHEFSKILQVAFIEDIFYGYEHEKKDSYFIQKLDSGYCQITSFEDACFNFSFNFGYFDIYPAKLSTFPNEFQEKYKLYQLDRLNYTWQELDSTKTICIKINEHMEYPYPPFAGLFEHVLEINDFKKLRKTHQELQNYKILVQKLPMREDTDLNNDYMIDYDNMVMFHNQAASATPDQVGVITTPMEVKEINFEKSGSPDIDNVQRAEAALWEASGISRSLFAGQQTNSVGLERSINTDEAIIFVLLKQFERWLNRKVKKNNKVATMSMRVHLLPITNYNEEAYFKRLVEGGKSGFPVKMLIGASLGYNPSTTINMLFLENDVLGLDGKLIPLQSSHTQNGDAGAPKKANASSSAVKTRDAGSSN
jgi:hypothetical protein